VSFGVKLKGLESKVVVQGPRIVQVSDPFIDSEDGLRTVNAEILEMYLYGYDQRGALITVKGGRIFGLSKLQGVIKALKKDSDFPARLYFDLELEIVDWGIM